MTSRGGMRGALAWLLLVQLAATPNGAGIAAGTKLEGPAPKLLQSATAVSRLSPAAGGSGLARHDLAQRRRVSSGDDSGVDRAVSRHRDVALDRGARVLLLVESQPLLWVRATWFCEPQVFSRNALCVPLAIEAKLLSLNRLTLIERAGRSEQKTGFVKAANGFGYAAARVTTPGLGTTDLSLPGGRYTSAVSAGANKTLSAKHPTLDEQGTATIATLAPEAVVVAHITVTPVPPTITSRQPEPGSVGQPLGSIIRVQFSEALDPASVGSSSIRVVLANADGSPSGTSINGVVALSQDHTAIAFTPSRPLPINVRLLCSFTGGARDAGGTPYSGALPDTWSFRTTNVAVTNSNIDPSKIRLLLPDASGVSQIVGEAGAIPSGWSVSADIDGPVICPSITTISANSQGAFTYTVGCPPTVPVTISSRVYLKVFAPEPGGTFSLADTIKLGPFTSADGKGVVADPAQDTTYTTPDGATVTVPAGAFDEPTLVTLRPLDPASSGVTLDSGMSVGAMVSVEFDGTARKTLRVKVPMPQDAVVGRLVFVGEPISLPWGRKLRMLDLARVVDAGGGQKAASSYLADQPVEASLVAGTGASSVTSAGRRPLNYGPATSNPYCLASLPCGVPCPGAPQPPACTASSATPPMPPQGCTICACSNLICSVMAELSASATAVFVHATGLELSALSGVSFPAEVGAEASVLYTSLSSAFVFVPLPNNWNGGFILPFVSGQAFSLVRRDPATGWITDEKLVSALTASPNLVDIGLFDPPQGSTAPGLLDARPFVVHRFTVPSAPLMLQLGVAALPQGSAYVQLAPHGASLSDGTSISLYNLGRPLGGATPTGYAASPDVMVVNGSWFAGSTPNPATPSVPADPGEPLLAVIGPGDVDPDDTTSFTLDFDKALDTRSTTNVATLRDCGRVAASPAASCVALPITVSFVGTRRLVVTPEVALPRGHVFQLDLIGVASAAIAPQVPVPLIGPRTLRFATRPEPSGSVGGAQGLYSLGDTNVARDILKEGNLLFAASATGKLVALDLSTQLVSNRLEAGIHAVMDGAEEQIRNLRSDGHGRVVLSSLLGGRWAVNGIRVEDVLSASCPSQTCPPPTWVQPPSGQPPLPIPPLCGAPPNAQPGYKCFKRATSGVVVSLALGSTSGLTGTEFLSLAGALPTGTPVDLDLVVVDETEPYDLAALKVAYPPQYASQPPPAPDALGYETFQINVSSSKHAMPMASAPYCESSSSGSGPYRTQRITVKNDTTGQSWSVDVGNAGYPWSATPVPTSRLVGPIRARPGDKLRVVYNERALVYVALVGGGLSVVDLNRFWDEGQAPVPTQGNKSQCGRRLASYEGQDASLTPCGGLSSFDGIRNTVAVATIPRLETTASGAVPDVDAYTVLSHFGGLRIGTFDSPASSGDELLSLKLEDQSCVVPYGGTPPKSTLSPTPVPKDVATAPALAYRAASGQPAKGDFAFLSLGYWGVLVYDVTNRAITPYSGSLGGSIVGRFGVPLGYQVFRLQVDRDGGRLLGGGLDDVGKPVVFAWDLARPTGGPAKLPPPQPPAPVNPACAGTSATSTACFGGDQRLLFTVSAPWDAASVAVDEGTGLLYTWGNEGGVTGGGRVVPVADPVVTLIGRYRAATQPNPAVLPHASEWRAVAQVVPLGAPTRLSAAAEATNADQDDRLLTAAFKVRMALPAGLADTLKAKVQSLRTLPDDRHLAASDDVLGSALGMPGGPGWPDDTAFVTMKRIAASDPLNGSRSSAGTLYESLETVLVMRDPRARSGYVRQSLPSTLADEEDQCRRCARPRHLPPSGAPSTDPVVEVLAAGPYLRVVVGNDGGSPDPGTDAAVAFFAASGDSYRSPAGILTTTAFAESVPSPIQVTLAEPPLAMASLPMEAGASVRLTSGEAVLSTVDLARPGRTLGFTFDRTWRSGTLGYGPLGSSGWHSSLFSRLSEVPVEMAPLDPLDPGKGVVAARTLLYYHDGSGDVYVMPSRKTSASDCAALGYDDDPQSSYCMPKGLYLRIEKLAAGRGWKLISPQHESALYDGKGRPTEIADRFGKKSGQGSKVLLTYDAAGQLVRVEDEMGRTYAFAYDEAPLEPGPSPRPRNKRFGLLASVTDLAGGAASATRALTYTFDANRLLTDVTFPRVTLRKPSGPGSPTPILTSATPTFSYAYGATVSPAATLPSLAPLHGADFEKLKLTDYLVPRTSAIQVPAGTAIHRLEIEYDAASGRARRVSVPPSAPGGARLGWDVLTASGAAPASAVNVTGPTGLLTSYGIGSGRITSISHQQVPVTTIGNPSSGANVATQPQSVTTLLSYKAADGRLTGVTYPDQTTLAVTYVDDQPTTATPDRLSLLNVVQAEHDSHGAVPTAPTYVGQTPRATTYGSVQSSFDYQGVDNLVTSLVDGVGRTHTPAVPEAGGSFTSGTSDGLSATGSFDAYGRPVAVVGGGGNLSVETNVDYENDRRNRAGAGFPHEVRQDQVKATLKYDDRDNLTDETSSQGSVVSLEYDEWDRPVVVTPGKKSSGSLKEAPAPKTLGYDEAGRLAYELETQRDLATLTSPTPPHYYTQYTYNERDQVVKVARVGVALVQPGGPVAAANVAETDIAYDPLTGLLASVTEPPSTTGTSVVTTYTHDVTGRLTGVTPGGSSGLSGKRETGYDVMSRPNYQTDGDTTPSLKGEWKGTYDAWGRLVTEVLPTDAVVNRWYDQSGGLREVHAYDLGTGQLLARVDDVNVKSWGDVSGMRLWQEPPTGPPPPGQTAPPAKSLSVTRTHDANGRLLSQSSGSRLDLAVTYENKSGRLLGVADASEEMRFHYAGPGDIWPDRIENGASTLGSCAAFSATSATELQHDTQGRVWEERGTDGSVTTRELDEDGLPLSVTTGRGTQYGFVWDSRGALVTATRPSGRGETRYGYQPDGRLAAKQSLFSQTGSYQTNYAYDGSGRLSATTRPDGGLTSYTYYPDDTLKDVVRSDGAKLTYTYDKANRVKTSFPSAPSPIAGLLFDGGQSYTYDALSRLTASQRLPGPDGLSGPQVTLGALDLAGRPREERVGPRAPLLRAYDPLGRVTDLGLPAGIGGGLSFTRVFEGCSSRLVSVQAQGIPAMGATWAWAGERLLGSTTHGPWKTAHRYGYVGGLGAPWPGSRAPGSDPLWQLGTLTIGTAGTSNPVTDAMNPLGSPQAPGSYPWGQLAYGYRKDDNAKLGRAVVRSPIVGPLASNTISARSMLISQGYAFGTDDTRRLLDAYAGDGSLSGTDQAAHDQASERFHYDYTGNTADLLDKETREIGARTIEYSHGSSGRPEDLKVDGGPTQDIAYEEGTQKHEGRRIEDDRYEYRWWWFGKLAKLNVKPGWGSPFESHQLRYEWDSMGRLFAREHLGALHQNPTSDDDRDFLERREYVWETNGLVAEASYADHAATTLRWRKTYVPGEKGLDDALQLRVETFDPTNGNTERLYSFLRDEQQTVLGVIEETGSPTAPSSQPPLKVRFLYSPFGEVHAEMGPEIRKGTFDQGTSSVTTGAGAQGQSVPTDYLSGALYLRFSLELDATTLSGIAVDRLVGGVYQQVPASQVAIGKVPQSPAEEVVVMPLQGWQLGTTYRVRLTSALKDGYGRSPTSQPSLEIPFPPPLGGQSGSISFAWQTPTYPIVYDNLAAFANMQGLMPGGLAQLFQGLYHDDVTGLAYARARWLDARTQSWITEDPLGDVDSPNLYGFVAGRPHESTDPLGLLGDADARSNPDVGAQLRRVREDLEKARREARRRGPTLSQGRKPSVARGGLVWAGDVVTLGLLSAPEANVKPLAPGETPLGDDLDAFKQKYSKTVLATDVAIAAAGPGKFLKAVGMVAAVADYSGREDAKKEEAASAVGVSAVAVGATEDYVTVYHGTSSNRASKIVGNQFYEAGGFRPSGIDNAAFFVEDFRTADFFARMSADTDATKSFTVIELRVPRSLAEELFVRGPIGEFREAPFVEPGLATEELVAVGPKINKLNQALKEGLILARRLRLPK